MTPYYQKNDIALYHGDLREVLPALSLRADHVVTDPPYGLGFMEADWDQAVPGPGYWRAIMAACKPGALLLAFGGTRTHHRLTCAIEDAHWEIRDCLMWLYGQGFPKAPDIGKMIDKSGLTAQQGSPPPIELAKEIRRKREEKGVSQRELASWFPQYSEVTKNWERLDAGRRIPSELDLQVLIARLNLSEIWIPLVRAEDRRILTSANGTDRTGDGTVYALGHKGTSYAATTDLAKQFTGYAAALKPAWEPIVLAMKALDGTYAANAVQHGVAGMNIDACRISCDSRPLRVVAPLQSEVEYRGSVLEGRKDGSLGSSKAVGETSLGRYPANLLLSEEAAAQLDEQTGTLTSGTNAVRTKPGDGYHGGMGKAGDVQVTYGDSGGASRFFYCGKATKKERGEGNDHPTVKPLALMKYLLTLLSTPTSGLILDPFAGSGTTALAALALGRPCVCVELEEHHCEIVARRLEAGSAH